MIGHRSSDKYSSRKKRKSWILTPLLALLLLGFSSHSIRAQIDEDQTGAWYMYFWSAKVKEGPWGFQGDIQYRNWNLLGDLEQLLLRGGLTYSPKNASILFTLGYAHTLQQENMILQR